MKALLQRLFAWCALLVWLLPHALLLHHALEHGAEEVCTEWRTQHVHHDDHLCSVCDEQLAPATAVLFHGGATAVFTPVSEFQSLPVEGGCGVSVGIPALRGPPVVG